MHNASCFVGLFKLVAAPRRAVFAGAWLVVAVCGRRAVAGGSQCCVNRCSWDSGTPASVSAVYGRGWLAEAFASQLYLPVADSGVAKEWSGVCLSSAASIRATLHCYEGGMFTKCMHDRSAGSTAMTAKQCWGGSLL